MVKRASQKDQVRINSCLRLLSDSFRKDFNSVRINTNNTLEHEICKLKKAYELIKDGKQILTEAIFKNGSRCDILILNDFQVIEILHTESEEEAGEKVKKYPSELDIIFLRTSDSNVF